MTRSADNSTEAVMQTWRTETLQVANDLCARAAVIVDFFSSCREYFEANTPARLDARDEAVANHPAYQAYQALIVNKISSKKTAAYGVKAAEQSVRAAALNFLHVALEETIHACLISGVRLAPEKVIQRLSQPKGKPDGAGKVETDEIQNEAIETWLTNRLRDSLPKKLELLDWLLSPSPETTVDSGFIADLNEARHDAIHRGGKREAADFPLVLGHYLAFGSCMVLIDRVLDHALPKGWRERDDAEIAKKVAAEER